MKLSIQSRILELIIPSRRWAWQSAFDCGLIENVETILKMCYNSLLDPCSNPDHDKVLARIGVIGSTQWEEYVIRVFKRLIEDKIIEDPGESAIGLRLFTYVKVGVRYFDVEEVAFREAI